MKTTKPPSRGNALCNARVKADDPMNELEWREYQEFARCMDCWRPRGFYRGTDCVTIAPCTGCGSARVIIKCTAWKKMRSKASRTPRTWIFPQSKATRTRVPKPAPVRGLPKRGAA